MIEVFLFLYLSVMTVILILSILAIMSGDLTDRVTASRAIILSPVWPVALVVLLPRMVKSLWEMSEWRSL